MPSASFWPLDEVALLGQRDLNPLACDRKVDAVTWLDWHVRGQHIGADRCEDFGVGGRRDGVRDGRFTSLVSCEVALAMSAAEMLAGSSANAVPV